MSFVKSKFFQRLREFQSNEDGVATIDFVLVFFPTMLLIGAACETAFITSYHVMLERGLDVTVRQVRIGSIQEPTHDLLTDTICEFALIIPDCKSQIRLEMTRHDPRDWESPPERVSCVDREEEGDPVLNFNPGLNNELMVLRACALFDPIMPSWGLGFTIPKESGGAYALAATSSYVMEPFLK